MDKRNLEVKAEKPSRDFKLGFSVSIFGWRFFVGISGNNKKTIDLLEVSEVE